MDIEGSRLVRGRKVRRLEPRVMDVLAHLLAHAGEVCSRREIEAAVWGPELVTDKALTRAISEIRKALGDDVARPRVLETIPRRGYRLKAAALEGPAGGTAGKPRLALIGTAVVGAVAVVVLLTLLGLFAGERAGRPPIQTRLTSDIGLELAPQREPGGRRIMFSMRSGAGDWDVFIKHPGSPAVEGLGTTASNELNGTWSPDGSRVAFLRHDGTACGVWVIDAAGGPAQRVYECTGLLKYRAAHFTPTLDWSPDGRRIAFSDRFEPGAAVELVLIDVETGHASRPISAPPGVVSDVYPAFSRDGAQLAFARNAGVGIGDVFVHHFASGETRRWTNDHRLIFGLDWAPGDRGIVYSANRSAVFELWHVREPGRVAWIQATGWNLKKPRVEGDVLVFEDWLYDLNLWHLPLKRERPAESLFASSWSEMDPDFNPADGRLAFVSNRDGEWALWIGQPGRRAVPVLRWTAATPSFPRWSPDGTRLALTLERGGDSDVHLVDARTWTLSALVNGGSREENAQWADDETLVYASDKTGQWELWEYDFGTGSSTQLTRTGGRVGARLPDGRLVFARPGRAGLWMNPDEPVQWTREPAESQTANWRIVGGAAYYLGRSDGSPAILRRMPRRRTAEAVMKLKRGPLAHSAALAVRADGGAFVLTQLDAVEADIIVSRLEL